VGLRFVVERKVLREPRLKVESPWGSGEEEISVNADIASESRLQYLGGMGAAPSGKKHPIIRSWAGQDGNRNVRVDLGGSALGQKKHFGQYNHRLAEKRGRKPFGQLFPVDLDFGG